MDPRDSFVKVIKKRKEILSSPTPYDRKAGANHYHK